jgi:hypothetical protein
MWLSYTFSPEDLFYKRFLVFVELCQIRTLTLKRLGSLNHSETFEAGRPLKTSQRKKTLTSVPAMAAAL